MTTHTDAVALTAERAQTLGLKLPDPSVDHVTRPTGGILPDEATSLTITVHLAGWPTTTGLGKHDLLMLVGSTECDWVTSAP